MLKDLRIQMETLEQAGQTEMDNAFCRWNIQRLTEKIQENIKNSVSMWPYDLKQTKRGKEIST
jgi:hypothetical protein